MMIRWRETILPNLLSGVAGAVAAATIVALVVIVPLQAQSSKEMIHYYEPHTASADGPVCKDEQEADNPRTICLANLKQLSLGLLQYQQDNDEKFPCGSQSPKQNPPNVTSGVGWGGQVYPYIDSSAVFICPSDQTISAGTKRPTAGDSYGINSNAVTKASQLFYSPSVTVILFDIQGDLAQVSLDDEGASKGANVFSAIGNGLDGSLLAGSMATRANAVLYATGYLGGRPIATTDTQFASSIPRHSPYSNVAFADGHTKFVLPSQISTGTDAPTSTAPQIGGITGSAAGVSNTGFTGTFSID